MSEEIAKIDVELAVLREAWMDARPDDKNKWMGRINAKLDERNAESNANQQSNHVSLP